MADQAVHRAGVLKQKNKTHKNGRHRTKGEIDRDHKGRVTVKVLTKKARRELNRQERRNRSTQIRKNKRDAVFNSKRMVGSKDGPPHLVAIIPLHSGISTGEAVRLLRSCDETARVEDGPTSASGSDRRPFGLVLTRHKQRLSFIHVDPGDAHALLDAAKVADTLLLLLEPSDGWDASGEHCLSCLFAQGLPSCVFGVVGASELPAKRRAETRTKLCRLVDRRVPGARPLPLDSAGEAALLLRQVWSQRRARVAFRERRAHMLAERTQLVPGGSADGEPATLLGTLKVTGYVRGRPLNVNGLIHLVGLGDFQMSQIDLVPDPLTLNPRVPRKAKSSADVEMQEDTDEVRVLVRADPARQVPLDCEAVPDPMEGEQTWPTDEELREAEESLAAKKREVRRVPRGTSDYQASWIIDGGGGGGEDDDDEDDDDDDEDDDDDDDDAMEEVAESQQGSMDDDASSDGRDEDGGKSVADTGTVCDEGYDARMDEEEDQVALEKYREERLDRMFPDEVDTPKDVSCRVRFQKYRGLKSFRTSPWDPKENLPLEYGRIFQFQNFAAARKRVLRDSQQDEEAAALGLYVTVHILNVPLDLLEGRQPDAPLVLFGLLPHEHKMSVVHFAVRRHPGCTEVVKAKEELVFHCGFRRLRAKPIFSQHTGGDKHKMERYLRSDVPIVATVYAPIMFPPASVLVFKQHPGGSQELLATGSLLKPDPNRVVVKRLVLSGHPFKINKKVATLRYMFFTREDIMWFKPVELRTKWGRRGHIKEPLGTHGHMKCVFDGQLKSQDTVLMNLYKRVFPPWSYDTHVPQPAPWEPGREAERVSQREDAHEDEME
uniref:Pre-rRNA-processing protein TSR1 homolog n=2 Tax=Petromyzon marinus TaxID=7757 RepID=A0AAJ7TVR1_PETMA|nr:pre-rRNA-processing protein TSR1 homolog isoform X1 [Petromyzon marinus]